MEPTKEPKKQVSPVEIELDAESELAGLHIMIVEDMGLVAEELRVLLADLGCHIVGVVSRLDEVVKLAKTTERLDGVLLDLNLSGEPAYPVAEILHERGIPLIIMSGYSTGHIRDDCVSDAHLQKPFSPNDLVAMMQRTFLPGKTA